MFIYLKSEDIAQVYEFPRAILSYNMCECCEGYTVGWALT